MRRTSKKGSCKRYNLTIVFEDGTEHDTPIRPEKARQLLRKGNAERLYGCNLITFVGKVPSGWRK